MENIVNNNALSCIYIEFIGHFEIAKKNIVKLNLAKL